MAPNQRVTIKYMRNKKEYTTSLVLTERKNPNRKETSTAHEGAHGQLSGLKVETLTPKLRKEARIPEEIHGVLV